MPSRVRRRPKRSRVSRRRSPNGGYILYPSEEEKTSAVQRLRSRYRSEDFAKLSLEDRRALARNEVKKDYLGSRSYTLNNTRAANDYFCNTGPGGMLATVKPKFGRFGKLTEEQEIYYAGMKSGIEEICQRGLHPGGR